MKYIQQSLRVECLDIKFNTNVRYIGFKSSVHVSYLGLCIQEDVSCMLRITLTNQRRVFQDLTNHKAALTQPMSPITVPLGLIFTELRVSSD